PSGWDCADPPAPRPGACITAGTAARCACCPPTAPCNCCARRWVRRGRAEDGVAGGGGALPRRPDPVPGLPRRVRALQRRAARAPVVRPAFHLPGRRLPPRTALAHRPPPPEPERRGA